MHVVGLCCPINKQRVFVGYKQNFDSESFRYMRSRAGEAVFTALS
jgi:hypothetical protein